MSHEIISDDEPIYRRVALQYCPDGITLSADAFKADKQRDPDGLSVSRGQTEKHPEFLTPQQLAGNGLSKRGYFIVELSVAQLKQIGIQIQFAPTDIDPGHCLLPQLRTDNRDDAESYEFRDRLARLNPVIHGPYPGTPRNEP